LLARRWKVRPSTWGLDPRIRGGLVEGKALALEEWVAKTLVSVMILHLLVRSIAIALWVARPEVHVRP
jgi:hypothetical protein